MSKWNSVLTILNSSKSRAPVSAYQFQSLKLFGLVRCLSLSWTRWAGRVKLTDSFLFHFSIDNICCWYVFIFCLLFCAKSPSMTRALLTDNLNRKKIVPVTFSFSFKNWKAFHVHNVLRSTLLHAANIKSDI